MMHRTALLLTLVVANGLAPAFDAPDLAWFRRPISK